jgi:opacity protein-like surface antigen
MGIKSEKIASGRTRLAGMQLNRQRAAWVGTAAATALMCLMGSSGALAQSCAPLNLAGPGGTLPATALAPIATGLTGGLAVSAAVSAANTAFLTQSTAFVSAPGNPQPYSEGSGVWVRGVGGELTTNTTTTINAANGISPGVPFPGNYTGSTACNAQFHQTFSGFQVGQDVAELNVNGWNIHLGTTAGFLQTSGSLVNGNVGGGYFNSTTEAPFVGTYAVATYGSFFVDGVLRYDYFQTQLNSPTANLFNQNLDAHGFTFAASTGYNWKVPNSSWFVEPSAGVVWSRESVDPFNAASPVSGSAGFGTGSFSGTTQVSDISSILGRAGVRIGTTLKSDDIVFQPFVALSVWHDFGSDITSSYSACANCIFNAAGVPDTLTAKTSTNNIGTFGQYSVGVAGQLVNTGWLGFVRVDYREGPNMSGLSGTGGIRYQFTPGAAPAMPVKAPVAPALVNWAGLYVGAIGGAETGHGSMYFPTSAWSVPGVGNFPGAGGSGSDMRPAGALGGGTLGYNWQLGRWVYGLEGDLAWTGAQSSSQCQPLNPPLVGGFSVNNSLFQTTCHDNVDWTATIAGRLGYALMPHSLVYAKAGVAMAGESFSETCNLGPLNGASLGGFAQNCVNASGAFVNQASVNTTAVGWTLGYGTEFAFTQHWSAKAEFDWVEFGHKSVMLSDGTAINTYQRTAQTKVGVNYRW